MLWWTTLSIAAAGTFIAIANRVDASSDELFSEDAPPDSGLSLVFYPQWEQRDPKSSHELQRVIGITHVASIDPVFQPFIPTACSKNLR